ncbi:aspartyl protease family protein [Fimbriiglobus ruber]|uniref:Peptidase A2 domain-containing protein n=1 Tax=Fimbriiglobus ruber TaxID=1908690 RepID=A0A225DCK4_9BACT|nr:aspartyl protease family protein [Fimbriiglobus ruber]OWK34859.1 hypothetical protein FRUB_09701 [Fimbriiglobus ruber]
MPSFRIPISWAIRDPDPNGPIRRYLRAAVTADIADRRGGYVRSDNLIVDTGAGTTTVSEAWARAHEIAVGTTTFSITMRTAAGLLPSTVRSGELRLRFPQLPDHVFRLYCVFSENIPPTSPLLLGLYDVLDVFRVTFDGRPQPDAVMGAMSFETV